MSAQRQLIVNADDFGQSPGTTRGILRAHDVGIVTSTSLMVRWPAAAEAVAAARTRQKLSVGLHIDLGEWRLQDSEWVPVYEVVPLEDVDAVAAEVKRQLDAFRRLVGREPTHLDSHQHVHRREPVRSVLVAVARELAVPLRHFAPQVRYCGDFYGQNERGEEIPGVLSVERLIEIIVSLPSGVTELACHPAYLDGLKTMYYGQRQQELSILCDSRLQDAIVANEVELCSFHELRLHVSSVG